MVKLFLDSGHGGTDGGAQGNGLSEKNLTLQISKKIEEILKKDYQNIEIMMSRTNDSTLSLAERTNKANKWGADCFLSIHINSVGRPDADGFETFIYSNPDQREVAFQNVMHQEIISKMKKYGIRDRGKKRANFHVLRESNMTALLSENLFISSPSDASKLKRADFIQSTAEGHVIGLEKFLGLKKSQQPPRTVSKVATSDTLYKVQVGAFKSRGNAEELSKELEKKGYNTYIVEA